MRYKTKVTYMTGGKEYGPGSILPPDISNDDLKFLKSKGFINPVDMTSDEEMNDDGTEQMDENDDFEGFDEMDPSAFKSPDEIRKIRSKKDILNYALSIGLDLGEGANEKSLKDLQEEVINFQEEKLDENVMEGD